MQHLLREDLNQVSAQVFLVDPPKSPLLSVYEQHWHLVAIPRQQLGIGIHIGERQFKLGCRIERLKFSNYPTGSHKGSLAEVASVTH